MTIRKYISHITLTLAIAPVAVMAGDSGAVYTQISSNGFTLGYGKSISSDVAVRGQYSFAKFSSTSNTGDFVAGSSIEGKVD